MAGKHKGDGGTAHASAEGQRFNFDGTKLAALPIPDDQPTQLPTALVKISTALQGQSPAATLASWGGPAGISLEKDTLQGSTDTLQPALSQAKARWHHRRRQLVAWQEELDWQIYEAFGLVEAKDGVSLPEGAVDLRCPVGAGEPSATTERAVTSPAMEIPPLELGERAFEIVLARKMAAGEAQSTWFARHGSTPITEVPRHWPAPYRELVERRLRRIADDPAIRLIEQPEYKRRWNTEPWDDAFARAARDWLLLRLETYFFGSERMTATSDSLAPRRGEGQGEESIAPVAAGAQPHLSPALSPTPRGGEGEELTRLRHAFVGGQQTALVSTNQLAAVVETDTAFLTVAEVYSGGPGFSVSKLVRELVEAESVPFLPFQRYKDTGLRKRQDWEEVWELQRREDAIDAGEKVDEAGLKDFERLARKQRADARKLKEVGSIPVPPKYGSGDFKKSHWWRLRGKLDVPKERWVIYPGAEREGDASPVIAWAGWDHAQQAQALAAYYVDASQNQGWSPERLQPLLAGLADLLPWLKQWHNAFNPDFGSGLGDYFAGFLDEEARKQGTTVEALKQMRLGLFATS